MGVSTQLCQINVGGMKKYFFFSCFPSRNASVKLLHSSFMIMATILLIVIFAHHYQPVLFNMDKFVAQNSGSLFIS